MRLSAPTMRRVAWFAMVCHVLVASGVPLPSGLSSGTDLGVSAARGGKDRSRPFPCMDKPCGCATAEQCFANCCCHSPTNRLAWARAHRVEPAVLVALEMRVAAAPAPAAGCCAAGNAASKRHTVAVGSAVDLDAADVCRAYRSLAAAPAAPPPTGDDGSDAPTPQTVILRDMLACGGIVTAWLACGTALPPPRVEPPAHDASAGGVTLGDAIATSVLVDPSTPPPRGA